MRPQIISRILATVPLGLVLSGCCVSNSLGFRNNTGVAVTVAAKEPPGGVAIPAGKQGKLGFYEGPLIITAGSNVWFYANVDAEQHPEARKRVFRFGVCQAGFGYFVTRSTLEADGRLTIGNGVYEPVKTIQW